jgi:hypothetical protein
MQNEPINDELRKPSEQFGTFPQDSEAFRSLPNNSEVFGNMPKDSERKEYCTLTVREVARKFEAAGVARTERSIINWCQPNKLGVVRLDNYFDPNERKYFISPQSVELAIQEEQAKASKIGTSEDSGSVPTGSERKESGAPPLPEVEQQRIRELEREVLDLKLANRGKDYFIEELKKERETFAAERRDYVEKLMSFNRKVGELETKLLVLEGPKPEPGEGNPGPGL